MDALMTENLRSIEAFLLVDNFNQFSPAVTKVNELVSDGVSDAAAIGAVIETDALLTVNLLRIANSASMGGLAGVDTVARAVAIMGAGPVRDLCFALGSRDAFKNMQNDIVTLDDFWSHSIYCGVMARELAKVCKGRFDAGAAFTAGVLHDIGRLVMFNQAQELCQSMLVEALGGEDLDVSKLEQKYFGFDHGQVGAELMASWKLPKSLQDCVGFHHRPTQASGHQELVGLVHAANVLANYVELGDADFTLIHPKVVEMLGLREVDIEALAETVREIVVPLLPIFSE